MVFEDLLNKIGKRKIYALFLGILYVMISYGTAKIFFPAYVSLAMIFFITLLLIPSTAKLINIEEKFESRDGLHHFIRDHYIVIEIFLFLFLGIFIGYLLTGYYNPETLSYQNSFLEKQGITGYFLKESAETMPKFLNIFLNNVSVIVISFVLSLFFGVGALFLIVLNASIFSQFLIKVMEIIPQKTNAALLLLYFIPEVAGFLLAAIAGGVISKAITKEKLGTTAFRNVMQDGTMLLVLSIIIILLAALIEVFLTPGLMKPLI